MDKNHNDQRITEMKKYGENFNKVARVIGIIIILLLLLGAGILSLEPNSTKEYYPLAILIFYLSIITKMVKPSWNWIIEVSGGKGILVWSRGIHFLWIPVPIFMKIVNKLYCADQVKMLQIGEKEGYGSAGKIHFTDASASVLVQAIFRIIDPVKATYEIDDWEEGSINRVESELRKSMGGRKLDEAMSETFKKEASKNIFEAVKAAIGSWGVKLNNPGDEISILEFGLDDETIKKRQEILDAQKEADAEIIRAEGAKKATIITAEGMAEGEQKKIDIIAKKLELKNDQVIAYLLTGKLFDAMHASTIIATSEGGTLNAPVNIAATMSAIQSAMKNQTQGGAR